MAHITEEEIRVVNPSTGGAKGSKEAKFSLIPKEQLWDVARLYGFGAEKYDRNNWRRGYDWSLSMDALERHLALFWEWRESTDEETQCHHLSSVVFHALALMFFETNHPELDDRPVRES